MTQDERKAALKLQRRQAYLAAKERQKNDPAYIALKEKQREIRRAAYQQQKEQRAAHIRAQKAKKQEMKQAECHSRDQALLQSLKKGIELEEPTKKTPTIPIRH